MEAGTLRRLRRLERSQARPPEAKGLPDTQLYDLSTDLAESKNLQAEHPEEVARLTKLLEEIIANGRSTPGAKQANDAAIQIRKQINGKAGDE